MKQLGRYEIIEKIGIGGMGTVYRANQPTLNKIVALKVLADFCAKDEDTVERFMREARIMASLPDYRHVVQVFDLDEIDGKYFYTMEYMPLSLSEHIGDSEINQDRTRKVNRKSKMMPVEQAIQFTLHILEGLKVIHKAGVTHRDISPQNIMLVKNGDELTAKITDFGIAGLEGSHLTKSATGIGKEVYASPEQLESLSDADARSDIYSLGILMYRMTTGRLPTGIRVKEPVELNPEVGEALNEIIIRATEQEPDDRYQSAAEMMEEMSNIEKEVHRTAVQKFVQTIDAIRETKLSTPGVSKIVNQRNIEKSDLEIETLRNKFVLAGATVECPHCAADVYVMETGKVDCPECGKSFLIKENGYLGGATVECPHCAEDVYVEETGKVDCPECGKSFLIKNDI